eukprot:CAMPEP_0174894006 /NCGR_PEP_ID=MMETSP0167-20121228/8716_1 /TAXON_ID=38298 /ORGANISM="Rhodella maculata, Strain CCMP736" /LENGTH=115 /DNA_ID=CAMNT_0016132965 /DNA_START=99 /DNA_END=443 /DNA_ORIENTATION=-
MDADEAPTGSAMKRKLLSQLPESVRDLAQVANRDGTTFDGPVGYLSNLKGAAPFHLAGALPPPAIPPDLVDSKKSRAAWRAEAMHRRGGGATSWRTRRSGRTTSIGDDRSDPPDG